MYLSISSFKEQLQYPVTVLEISSAIRKLLIVLKLSEQVFVNCSDFSKYLLLTKRLCYHKQPIECW